MSKLKVLDLFSGIGGFSLGLERTGGFETVAFCEIEDFPRKVLAKHWPEVPQYEDVRQLTGDILKRDGISVDVITGGFPCQDISVAGKQAGINENTRSGLWSEIVRLIGDLRPKYVIVENVSNLLSGPSNKRGGWFGRILSDLAECGYDAEWENIPASAVGASHRRERVWIVAYPSQMFSDVSIKYSIQGPRQIQQLRKCGGANNVADTKQGIEQTQLSRKQRCILSETYSGRSANGFSAQDVFGIREWGPEPDICRVANGVPRRAHRLGGLGNAVVPQIPELIGNAILAAESDAA
jgi:DNA (cytosine-5)-methyltransferase 1